MIRAPAQRNIGYLIKFPRRFYSTPVQEELERGRVESEGLSTIKEKQYTAALAAFEARTGIKFKNQSVLRNALIHKSVPLSADDSCRFHLLGWHTTKL